LFSSYLDKDLQTAIIEKAQTKLKEQLYELFEKCKEQNIDIFDVASACKHYKNDEWQTYLAGLENKNEYLQNCNLNVEIEFDKIR
jgi:hypothetical protein